MSALIKLNNISVIFDNKKILNNVSLNLTRKNITTIMGPNGAGKSTLIKIVLGLIQPNTGTIEKKDNIKIGYVPQKNNLNSSIPLTVDRFLKLAGKFSYEKRVNALKLVDASHIIKSNIHTLSGGETQRVLLARAMLRKPDLLVLDEPVQGVDINGQDEIYKLITQLRDKFNCAIMMVSHDLHLVMAKTDQVLCLHHHLCCKGTPETIIHNQDFIKIFGLNTNTQLGIYKHKHNYNHSIDGFDLLEKEKKEK